MHNAVYNFQTQKAQDKQTKRTVLKTSGKNDVMKVKTLKKHWLQREKTKSFAQKRTTTKKEELLKTKLNTLG